MRGVLARIGCALGLACADPLAWVQVEGETPVVTVHEAVYNASGVLQQLAVDIEHRCEGRDPPLFAEVRLNSGVPIAYFGGAGGPRRKRAFDGNGDGRADLLWQHTDGRQAMWLMENETVVGSAALLPAASGWSVVQFGDFNGDGKSDILWRHTDGRIAMWLMDGAAQIGGGLLLAGGTGWTPLLIGDTSSGAWRAATRSTG